MLPLCTINKPWSHSIRVRAKFRPLASICRHIAMIPPAESYVKQYIHFLTLSICHFSQQTVDMEAILAQCWSTFCEAGPTLNQHWVNVLCLLGKGGESGPDSVLYDNKHIK